jgi:hypothetical protein
LLNIDCLDKWSASLAVDGLDLFESRHLETAPASIEVEQRLFDAMANVLKRVWLEIIELGL